jgi:hypothetical protein
VNGRQCQGVQGVEVVSFDGNAQGDQRKVDDAAAGLIGRTRARAAYFEMCKVDEARQPTNEGWNVRRGMEKRWILVGQKFCNLFVVVL